MKNIGITGQSGFIGYHLSNTLKLYKEKYNLINFENYYFNNEKLLENFAKNCDVIIHLAAVNRHKDPNYIYKTNTDLVKKLINACEKANNKPHIIFSSSIQEDLNNEYGKSKAEGRKLFENFARQNNSDFTALIIPNVFGPFSKPFYNSFIATFCYQIANNKQPEIIVDNKVKLIYVNDLVKKTIDIIDNTKGINTISITAPFEIRVSDTINILENFKKIYLTCGNIPDISDDFTNKLFKTFLTYIDIKSFYPVSLKKNTDSRGVFVELIKTYNKGQISFSTTKPQITRGNHFHLNKFERFAVIKGTAQIQLRKIGTNEVITYKLSGDNPAFVDIPVWYTHNLTNIGNDDLYTIFWCDELYNEQYPDTYFEIVK